MSSVLVRKGKIDVRIDEEQNAKLLQTLDLLNEAGYYRARIKGLPPFDKIVGGMSWCIEICNVELDIDILFHDSLSIGQKIAVTERIVQCLPSLKCPHPIEPHQIQGLDAIHFYPVVKWLVGLAVETRAKYQDETRIISLDEFTRQYKQLTESSSSKNKHETSALLRTVKMKFENDGECEYGPCISTVHTKQLSSLQEKGDATQDSKNLKCNLMQQLEILKKDQERLQIDVAAAKKLKGTLKSNLAQLICKHNDQSEQLQQSKWLAPNQNNGDVGDITKLLTSNEVTKKRMSAFKTSCLDEEVDLKKYISDLEGQLCDVKREEECVLLKRCAEEEAVVFGQYECELTAKNRRIHILKRQLDNFPARAELSQYQRRFLELFHQESLKHYETLQFNNLLTSLSESKSYIEKEICLLNSISDTFTRQIESPQHVLDLIGQLQDIVDSTADNKNKLEAALANAHHSRDNINSELNKLKDLQLVYAKLLRQLTHQLAQNE